MNHDNKGDSVKQNTVQERDIYELLKESDHDLTVSDISRKCGMSIPRVEKKLVLLWQLGLVKKERKI